MIMINYLVISANQGIRDIAKGITDIRIELEISLISLLLLISAIPLAISVIL